MKRVSKIKLHNDDDESIINIPQVDFNEEQRIRIYDHKNDGSYYFREIGFTSELWKENKQ